MWDLHGSRPIPSAGGTIQVLVTNLHQNRPAKAELKPLEILSEVKYPGPKDQALTETIKLLIAVDPSSCQADSTCDEQRETAEELTRSPAEAQASPTNPLFKNPAPKDPALLSAQKGVLGSRWNSGMME